MQQAVPSRIDRWAAAVRNAYVAKCCNEREVNRMLRLQSAFPKYDRHVTRYFELLSFFGEPPFYTFFIPFLFWVGLTKEAAFFCWMMSVTLYFIDNAKDMFGCPRPPCPPLRRAGTESHGFEYGCPSTHIGLGLMCAYHIIICCSMLWPRWELWMWLIGVSFTVQTAISRVYLGLHWPGDLMGGAVIFLFCLGLQEVFLRPLCTAYFASDMVPWYTFVLSHIFTRLCVTPSDPCPCYEDTVRFIGAAAGSMFGGWLSIQHHPSVRQVKQLPHDQQAAIVFSGVFWVRSVIGMILIAVLKTVVSVVAPKLLKPLYLFLSGYYREKVPRRLRPLYHGLCFVAGILICCGAVPRRGVVHTNKLREEDDATHLKHTHVDEPSSPSVTATVVCVEHTSPMAPTTTVLVWPVRMHQHWWLWDIHTKSLAYIVVGLSATYLLPFVLRPMGLEYLSPA